MGEHLGGIEPVDRDLHQRPPKPDRALGLDGEDGVADAHVGCGLQPPAGLVEAHRVHVAAPPHRTAHFGQHDVAIGEVELLQVAQRPAQARTPGQVREEPQQIGAAGPRGARGLVAQGVAAQGRDADRSEEVIGGEAPGGDAGAEDRSGRQSRLEPARAQHRPALAIGQRDVAQLDAERMGCTEPGDLDGPDARAAAPHRGRQPALGHRPEGVGGDMALRQPPRGEAEGQDRSRHDADQRRRDMSDGWPQQAGIPLPRPWTPGPVRLCASAECPP